MIEDPRTMKSPITGGKMTLHWEWREMEYRKEKYRVMFPFYRCEDTGEQFTTTESDGVWWNQVLQQYCQKYGLPYKDEIIALRKHYGVNATKMSLILGFGENQYRKYEQEEFPNVSNGRMIRSAMNPMVFLDLVESARGILSETEYEKITTRLKSIIADGDRWKREQYETARVFTTPRGEENGFAPVSLSRLKAVMLLVLQECGEVFCTKMNKLLFYIDFLS
ncbi:MAG: XRE family transcriptional regulator, partial [Fibrobacter sp.]|nr:XRE family transcriptional regulator [Fibrobacter sp.]